MSYESISRSKEYLELEIQGHKDLLITLNPWLNLLISSLGSLVFFFTTITNLVQILIILT